MVLNCLRSYRIGFILKNTHTASRTTRNVTKQVLLFVISFFLYTEISGRGRLFFELRTRKKN